jgi:hypothetical protein
MHSSGVFLHHSAALLRGRLALHLLRDLDVDFEELAHAAVEAHGLALVEVGFTVLRGNALLGAGVDEPGRGGMLVLIPRTSCAHTYGCSHQDVLVEHVGDHLDLGFCCCDLLCGRRLGTTAAEEERHCVWSFVGVMSGDMSRLREDLDCWS